MTTRIQKIILSVLVIFSINYLNAQIKENPRFVPSNLKYKDCDLQEKNKNWLDLITNENRTSKKIELIKEKINSDTIYKKYIPELKIHSSSLNLEHINSQGVLCGIKILFVIEYGKRRNIYIDLNENPEYSKILKNINSENVSIWILNPKQGAAIYGTSGSSGVIYIKTKNKNLRSIIKSTIKKNVG